MGYGEKMVSFLFEHYKESGTTMLVGTGGSVIEFYYKCGFVNSYIIKNFFTDNYDHPITEKGKQITDMIYSPIVKSS